MSRLKPISILLALAVAVMAPPIAAAPQVVRGDQFIEMMKDNTLSGKTAAGAAFNIYFVEGGSVKYEDGTGMHDAGRWHLDQDGDVCVTWQSPADKQEGCFRVTVDGSKIAWEGKAGSGRATLRGDITEMYLNGKGQ